MKANWIIPAICLLLILPLGTNAGNRYKEIRKIITYEDLDELEVEIEIGIAELIIGRAKGNNLLEADITYNTRHDEPEIRFRKTGKSGRLTIESGKRDHDDHGKGDHDTEDRWELLFSPKVPISFSIEIGLVDGELDMTGLMVRGLDISGGLSDMVLTFDEPNSEIIERIDIEVGLGECNAYNLGNANFETLKLECGLGSTDLELDGEWKVKEAELNLEVGLGSAVVKIPEFLGVEVYKEGSFLSSVSLDRAIREERRGLYRTSNWEDAEHRVSIDAEVGLGSIKIKIVD